jgi:hypothetical protein
MRPSEQQTQFEVHDARKGRVEKFTSDVDPEDAVECVALLRRRARELRLPVEGLRLVTWAGRRARRIEYRA